MIQCDLQKKLQKSFNVLSRKQKRKSEREKYVKKETRWQWKTEAIINKEKYIWRKKGTREWEGKEKHETERRKGEGGKKGKGMEIKNILKVMMELQMQTP
jgi:hypothetical protein